jgi:putative salt-induced outer membrane protein YdiY
MNLAKHLHPVLYFTVAALAASVASADVVETKGGSRIVGNVSKIDSGIVYVATDYAGDLKIDQTKVTGITTDAPAMVRLANGTTLQGTIAVEGGQLKITSADAQAVTPVAKIVATWPVGGEDPAAHHWSFEASVDLAGKTGNSEQLGTAGSFRAKLKTPEDTLQVYTAYNRQVANGIKSSDQFKAGIDYQDNFSGRKSWYARDEAGFDRVKDIDLYNTAAVGYGYDFIKLPKHLLTGRVGLSYRYENYANPAHTDLSSAGLDFGLNHEWEFATWKLVNRLTYDPSFDDFSNFHFTHESFYEVPLADPAWKLRLGVSNDYNSKPGPGLERLDTSYFTRLVLTWK